jgi:3-dehydroquinate dehydratase-2
MKKVLVIHGPNLNLLGEREPEKYGRETLEEINQEIAELARELGLEVECFQSNHEGDMVERIQAARKNVQAILINPAGYTHTSVSIRDALLTFGGPVVEVHLSNLARREEFRKRSLVSDIALGTISGFGKDSYLLGIRAVAKILAA